MKGKILQNCLMYLTRYSLSLFLFLLIASSASFSTCSIAPSFLSITVNVFACSLVVDSKSAMRLSTSANWVSKSFLRSSFARCPFMIVVGCLIQGTVCFGICCVFCFVVGKELGKGPKESVKYPCLAGELWRPQLRIVTDTSSKSNGFGGKIF